MITFNVYDRVYQVRWKGCTGTSFTTDIDGRQYLISAKHVFEGIKNCDRIEIYLNNAWREFKTQVIGIAEAELDVVVLAVSEFLSPSHPLPLTKGNVALSQDVYFVGFPFGMSSPATAKDGLLSIPLVKKACLSGIAEEKGQRLWILDGFNNPGFSGGPVIVRNDQEMVFGIISGYRYNEEIIYQKGQETEFTTRSNTGIIYAYSAAIAIDMIKANPQGTITK